MNVRKLTVTTDKEKYGVRLRAQPDLKALGARLKGALKTVMTAMKDLTDKQLSEFQKTGKIEIAGHMMGADDLRLMYAVDDAKKDKLAQYEAHSDNDVSTCHCVM